MADTKMETQHNESTKSGPWKIALAILLMLAMAYAFAHLMSQAFDRPPAATPPQGDEMVLRDIDILIDRTRSLDPGKPESAQPNFEAAKRVIIEDILPNIGPGDHVQCYSIGTDFSQAGNLVFGGKIEGLREGYLNPENRDYFAKEIDGLWAKVESEKARWQQALDALQMQTGGKSNYLGAFDYLSKRVVKGAARHVLVVGDLAQDPVPSPLEPPDPSEEARSSYARTAVTLLYTYKSTLRPDPFISFWRTYFEQRGNSKALIAPYGASALPPSKVPR